MDREVIIQHTSFEDHASVIYYCKINHCKLSDLKTAALLHVVLRVRKLGPAQEDGLSPHHEVSPGTAHLGLEGPKGSTSVSGALVLALGWGAQFSTWPLSPVG